MSEGATTINACWKSIGLWGDRSCPDLARHMHCRNCEVFCAAAASLLDRQPPAGYLEEWTVRTAKPQQAKLAGAKSIIIFRLGEEWLALPTAAFLEVAALRTVHSLPHRKDGIVKGLVNVRGELLLCLSLERLLGLEAAPKRTVPGERAVYGRLIVVERNGKRAVFPVSEVYGGHRYHPAQLKGAPATVALSANPHAAYSIGLLPWKERHVGVLDEELLFYTLGRHLESAS